LFHFSRVDIFSCGCFQADVFCLVAAALSAFCLFLFLISEDQNEKKLKKKNKS